ncbi:MAG: NUDIX domain-containing protein [Hydrogenibacillus schlegelii]|nr:NUDIX domain-containing protein [Hydrogenibacillus schlegelii]
MRRVVNCLITDGKRLLMLQKPRRGYWYIPGGKVEPAESLGEAVRREVEEETGLVLTSAHLRGAFVIDVQADGELQDEWMLFTFVADGWSGTLKDEAAEGVLAWQPVTALDRLPMPAGDRIVLSRLVFDPAGRLPLTGRFVYTPDEALLAYAFDPTEAHEADADGVRPR